MFTKIRTGYHGWVARRQVARGIAWLENTNGREQRFVAQITGQPLNIDRIKTDRLDIGSSNACALAQASGWDYNRLIHSWYFELNVALSPGWMRRHGFNARNGQRIRALTDEWRRQLDARRAKDMAAIQTYVQTQFADDVKRFVEAVKGL